MFQVDKMGVELVNARIKALDENLEGDLLLALQGG